VGNILYFVSYSEFLKFSRDLCDFKCQSQIFLCFKNANFFFIILNRYNDTPNMRSSKEKTNNSISIIVQQAAIDAAVEQLIRMTDENNGRLPHQAMEEAIDGLRLLGINVDWNFINYRKRMKLEKQSPLIGTDVNVGNNLSTQSEITTITNIGSSNSSASCSLSFRGRPSGTTSSAKQKRMKLRSDCINEIATLYNSELINSRLLGLQNSRTNVGFLKKLVTTKWNEYGLTEFDDTVKEVSCETIRNRVKCNNNLCTWKRGPRSPLSDIEDLIVDICIRMGKIRQPLTVGETIDLANSLIEGKEQQQQLIRWKLRCNPDLPLEAKGRIGYGWFQGFKKRHGSRLVTKRGERFAADRADWSKYMYIKQMYDVIYDNMVEAGIAEEIEDPITMDIHGNMVEKDDPQKFGLPCDITVLYPEFILFADETGCNTNQKKDGHLGGTKYVVERNTVPKEISSTCDKHFTVLGVTAASGEPVPCVVIFASEQNVIPENWVTGIDIQKSPLMEEFDATKVALDSENFGENKYFPGGPCCNFLGKKIPCLPLCSPSGGITADLLISILKYIDHLNVFNRREGGPTPLLIVDGHESRLDTSFLEYINDATHKWFVSLGVPYATSYWQVGDASEQNGQFKMEMTRVKRILTSFKSDKAMKIGINYTDVMPLINKSWNKSFGCISTNQKAIADRGWFPPNRNLLLHPDIIEQFTDDSTSNMNPTNLNVSDGTAGSCFDRILKYRSRNDGILRQRENIHHGKSITEALESGRRLTSGLIVARGHHSLNNCDLLHGIRKRKRKQDRKARRLDRKVRNELIKRSADVIALRLSKPDISKWSRADCTLYIQYKKQKGDLAMPKSIIDLRSRCNEIDRRKSPTCTPCQPSDDDGSDDSDDDLLEQNTSISNEVMIVNNNTELQSIDLLDDDLLCDPFLLNEIPLSIEQSSENTIEL
jgi:hypothetical protein